MAKKTFRCMKCKKSVQVEPDHVEVTSKGGYMFRGKHSECGTKVCVFTNKADASASGLPQRKSAPKSDKPKAKAK